MQPEALSMHPRALLDGLFGLLKLGAKAGEDESGTSAEPTPTDNSPSPTDHDTTGDGQTEDTGGEPTPTSTTPTRTPPPKSSSTTGGKTSDAGDTTTVVKTTTTTTTTPTTTSKETKTEKTENTAGTVVTITGPGVTKTTVVGPPPTIDDPNGSKADVGASSNLTSIIVASTVTAVALLACTVLFYVYRYRKNRRTYGDDDFFAKGMGGVSPHSRGANTMTTTSPFIPPGQPSSDGYVAEPGHGRFVSVGDNSHLLANQPYRQVHPAPVHYRQQSPPPHNPFSLQPHGQ
ncbi:hypothetical protein H4R21_001820 [Coemansia helicoidea]|uniref:Uncharacterized protein n=1 Tax=Coemansia helicoidea TaxID=1286919 RepID=A0ACC1L9M5_9FUNG|nr:hypothetical protein H4R21_001820 [Coemansia helicoidea]